MGSVVYLWAPWCMECRAMSPYLDAVAAEFADSVAVEKIDVAASPDVAARLEVMATPTIIGRTPEKELFRVTGRRTPTELREMFAAVAAGSSVPRKRRRTQPVRPTLVARMEAQPV